MLCFSTLKVRLPAFGFLGGREVEAVGVGNIGLEDQRVALRWAQKYIRAFGGDPSHVTIWGATPGAISVSLQMFTNHRDTEGLFHGAFMQSGAPIPVGNISTGQPEDDKLVQDTPCGSTTNTLDCLRRLPYEVLEEAIARFPFVGDRDGPRLAWVPLVDGRFLTDTPQKLVLDGSIAGIPHVSGNVNDEGTLFSIFNTWCNPPVSNGSEFRAYIRSKFMPEATDSDIGDLFDALYPDDPSQGSPFGTGRKFSFPLQYKRMAAIQDDLVFQAPRRFFVERTFNQQLTWSFRASFSPIMTVSSRQYDFIPEFPTGFFRVVSSLGDMTDYLIHFVNHGNPNGRGNDLLHWPRYDNQTRPQVTFEGKPDSPSLSIRSDTYREDGFKKLTELCVKYPF